MSRARRIALVLALSAPLLLSRPGGAPAQQPAPAKPDPTVFDQAWQLAGSNYYDRTHHGVDWKAARLKHRPRALRARTQGEVHEAIIALLAELKASHAEVIEPDMYVKHLDAEAKGIPTPQFGFKLTKLSMPGPDGKPTQRLGFFVSQVLPGGAAAAAGILRGDRIIAINGQPPHERDLRPVPYDSGLGGPRSYRISSTLAGQSVKLELERARRTKGLGLFTATVTSSPWNEVEASRAGMRIYRRMGFELGYMRLYHLLTEELIDMLEEFITTRLTSAHGFILDLRGRGGVPSSVARLMKVFDPNAAGGPLWGRPVVALIDGGTRSVKEVLAFEWRRRKIGPLVGETTRGAVLGATFKKLKDGAWLMLPVMDMRAMTGGVVLEGVGVAPDVKVVDRVQYSQGQDWIREKGIEVLLQRVLARHRVGKKHGWY